MDLDGDRELEFEELLTTVVHIGLAATEHLLLTPIAAYREGPQYLVNMNQVERTVRFIPEREAIMVLDQGRFACRLFDPSMKRALAVELPLSSALAVEYVHGVQVDTQQNNSSYRRGNVSKASYYTSGRPSAKDERKKAREALEALNAAVHKQPKEVVSMWDKLSTMPLCRPLPMQHGQPLLQQHLASIGTGGGTAATTAAASSKDDDEGGKPPSATLISQYAAKPYYAANAGVHTFSSSSHSSNASGGSTSHGGVSLSAAPLPGKSSSGSSSSSAYERTPLVFLQEDWLVTSTSQHLQLWDGFPTGPASLCDSKKIRNSYSCIKWCAQLQRLFCGDVLGGIDVWRILLLPHPGGTAPPSRPTLVKEKELVGHTDIITGLESISSMGFLLSCSMDASVRMYDLQGGVEKNRFIGHRAGVVGIAYSNEYRFLLSAGSDHQVCVWSPFADKVVFTLRGHHAPLIGVQFVTGTPQIVTADSDGCIKIWDARNFSCCQTFQSMAQISSFTACSQRHKRIFVVGKCHEIQVYEQEGGPFLRRPQEEPIFTAAYSPFTMTMLTANRQDVKVWDGITGNLSRVYRGLADTDITAVCLDARQRKLFVADQAGKIRCYNYLTGAYMKSLTPHNEEVIALCYSGSRRLLISATDRSVFVHDERPIEEAVLYMTVTSGEGAEYLVVSVSERLSILACAMSNGKVDLWNLDQAMRDVPIAGGHPDVITALSFIDEHQLLLSADDSGNVMAWFVRPSRWKGQLAFQLQTPGKALAAAETAVVPSSPSKHTRAQSTANPDPIRLVKTASNVPGIGCMSFHASTCQLFCGHRNGHILVWDLKPLLDFIARVAADPTASWFVNTPQTSTILPPLVATSSTAAALALPALYAHPSSSVSSSVQASPALRSRPVSTRDSPLLSNSRRSNVSFSQQQLDDELQNVPIKDQLARLAQATKPSHVIQAHDGSVATLHVVHDPPSLLSAAAGDHVCHVWSLTGESMGVLDPVVGLAKGYELSAPPSAQPVSSSAKAAAAANAAGTPAWRFRMDVATRAANDRAATHEVLKSLERMALDAQEAARGSASAQASARSNAAAAGDALQLQSPYGLRSPMKSPEDKSRQPAFPLALPAREGSSGNKLAVPTGSPHAPAGGKLSPLSRSASAIAASSQRVSER